MEGRGPVAIWGASPAVNFFDIDAFAAGSTIQVLSVGAADPRHILHTLNRGERMKTDNIKMHFHIIESQAPLIARMLLLFDVLFGSVGETSIQDNADKFLEIFGNLLLRGPTWQYIQSRCNDLIRVVTDAKGFLADIFDFSSLKFKEKDDIEFVFKFWSDPKKSFDVLSMWDHRHRAFYKNRFDHRENLADWDYHMTLAKPENKQLDVIHKREFQKWRVTGIAFDIREAAFTAPNRTMATVHGLKQDGLTTTKWGYFSDIALGPFICYGIDPKNKDVLKKSNDMYTITSQEISKQNIIDAQLSLQSLSGYTDSQNAEDFHGYLKQNLKVSVLPFDHETTLQKKRAKYTESFDVVYLACHQAFLVPLCHAVMKKGATLVVEDIRLQLDLTKEQKDAFKERVAEMAANAGFVQVPSKDEDPVSHGYHLMFRKH